VLFDKGLILSELSDSGTAIFLMGIDPAAETQVRDIAGQFVAGRIEDLVRGPDDPLDRIALGHELARTLGVGPGDRVRVIVPHVSLSPWGVQPRGRAFEVAGIVDTGFYDYDSSWAWLSRDGARRLLGVDDVASVIQARVADLNHLDEVRGAIQEAVGEGYPVTDMIAMNRTFFAALRMEKLLTFLVIALVVIVAALNIRSATSGRSSRWGRPPAASCESSWPRG
jgi:lipoprotein-releasing system permease protein